MKPEKYRNKKITQGAKGAPCMRCGVSDGTIVAAHSNFSEDGKGAGTKAHDIYVAYLCYKCHTWLDESGAPKEEKRKEFHRAWYKTLKYMFANILTVDEDDYWRGFKKMIKDFIDNGIIK